MKRLLFVAISLICLSGTKLQAQFVDGTSGLLCMPSAEMPDDATFMITNNFLNKAFLPDCEGYGWNDHGTFGYAIDVAFWGRLEIAYSCTIIHTSKMRPGIYTFNQDRHFAAKVGVTKEGDFGKEWMPSLSVGISDLISSGGAEGDYIDGNVGSTGNGFFNRYYIVASKSFQTPWGDMSGHLGYQYSRRKDGMPTGPQAAVTWNPIWLKDKYDLLSGFRATLEYDARCLNIGVNASIWEDRFEFMAMLFAMHQPMVGARYKLRLSH